VYCLGSSEACVVGGCVMVEVICDRTGDFSVPTAFTPNKDGINDKYCLKGWGECNTGFNIKIFDRWGEMVFESNDPNFCWDGEFNGNLLPTATYVYFINADFERVPGYRQSGNISLIR
jgi:gliding motility-associated-like protein